jgi:hypothetical protein
MSGFKLLVEDLPMPWNLLCSFVVVCSVAAQVHGQEPSSDALRDLHTREAQAYRIHRDPEHKELLEMQPDPAFTWTNLVGDTAQYGHIFVWSWRGRPEAIGTIFSTSDGQGGRKLIHEFHTLSERRLFPVTPEYSAYEWTPEKGLSLDRLEDAPAPAASAAARLRQMRDMARSYSVETINAEGAKFDLRLLPTPVARYDSPPEGVVDGALFALVMSVGTDPEAILLIEARERDPGQPAAWEAAVARFSDRDVTVRRNGRVHWSSKDDPTKKVAVHDDWRLLETPDRTYMCYQARVVEELPTVAE